MRLAAAQSWLHAHDARSSNSEEFIPDVRRGGARSTQPRGNSGENLMTDHEIKQQIRSKELQIQRLETEIREARGYIAGLRRQISRPTLKAADALGDAYKSR